MKMQYIMNLLKSSKRCALYLKVVDARDFLHLDELLDLLRTEVAVAAAATGALVCVVLSLVRGAGRGGR